MTRLGWLVLATGAAWLIGFAAIGQFTWTVLAAGALYTLIAAATLARPGRLAPRLLGLYLAAAVGVWVLLMVPGPIGADVVSDGLHWMVLTVSLLWGGFIWAGLLALPFIVETTWGRRSPS